MIQAQRILLTGGSGFIGSEVLRFASEAGFEVLNLDIKPPREEASRSVWRQADVRDLAQISALVSEFVPDRIVHLASDIDVTNTQLDHFRTTIEGTRNMIAVAEALPALKRFVHVSTQYVVRPGILPKSETEYVPYTVYGQAKAETEKLIQASRLKDWVIARPTIIWGPQHPSFAQQIWRRMAEGSYRHPRIGKPLMRGYGYVTNTAWQMYSLAKADRSELRHGIYYLGDGEIDYDLWADAFCKGLTGKPARRISTRGLYILGMIGSGMRRLGLPAPYDMGRYFRMTTPAPIDFRPIQGLVGPSPVSFEQGVKESLDWLAGLHS